MVQTIRFHGPILAGFVLAFIGCSDPAVPMPTTSSTSPVDSEAITPDAASPAVTTPTGLQATDPADRVQAIRAVMKTPTELSTIVPLLADPVVDVRRAAILAVGPTPADGPTVVGPEELFPCLHDADRDVRELAVSALKSRGLDDGQVELARQLVSPNAADRLQLLHDLAIEHATIPDPSPWLERLSRDPEPAVRAGTARVAHERRLRFTSWLDRLADHDPDPTVRQVAGWYRGRSEGVRQVGFVEQ